MTDLTFSIGEVAAMLGISPHTIRAWERRHLMVTPTRTASGQRRYSSDDVDLLRLASELVIDAVVEPEDLRGELIARLALAQGKDRTFSERLHGIPPV